MRARHWLAVAALALAVVGVAGAAPTMPGNAVDKAQRGIVIDSLTIPNGKSRTICLFDVAPGTSRSNVDSLQTAWIAGSYAPTIRRMQHLVVWNADQGLTATQVFDMTIYRGGSTTTNKGIAIWPYSPPIDIPCEADSIKFTSHTSTGVVSALALGLCYW